MGHLFVKVSNERLSAIQVPLQEFQQPTPIMTYGERGTGQNQLSDIHYIDFLRRVNTLEEDVRRLEKANIGYIKINRLVSKNLSSPLDATIEPDDSGFIARLIDLPLYGFGDDPLEAVDALKDEIESTYRDLMEDDDFSDEWLRMKAFLNNIVIT